ncbi:mitochondrial outer membrane protein porin 2-like [Salvia splendens]|uniref:mitochondrial outer membrane protein porin 2-like n=1 Tax=Salvia splendens TaxID=180675 RepID=UPI001C271CBF|nr:mitochondrial outer membrane protein porin 2-like [Salvia splendens]
MEKAEQPMKKGGYSSGDIQLQYASNNAAADLKVDTESNIAATVSVADIIPSSKTIASLKYPNYDSGKVVFHSSIYNYLGTPTFALGAEAAYETSSRKLTKYTAGITVTKPDSGASITLGDKGDTLTESFIHYVDQSKRSAAGGEIARKFSTNHNTFTVGGSYALDDLMLVKFKLNNHGALGLFCSPKS